MNSTPRFFVNLCAGVLACSAVATNAADPKAQPQGAAVPEGEAGGKTYGMAPRQRTVSGDLALEKAINLALKQNPEVLRSVREIQRVHGQIVEARAQALPHLAVNTTFDRIQSRINGATVGADTFYNAWTIAFELKQALYAGGQISSGITLAKLSQDVSFYNLRDVLDRTVSEVRKQFAQVLITAALIDVAQESVELASKQLEDATNRFEAGTVPRFNVLRAEVELANVRPTLIKAKNDYLIAQLQLAKTMGLDALPNGKPSFNCVGNLKVRDVPFSLGDALSLGRARRPMLKSQRQQILVEKERIQIARAGFKPRLDARADYQFKSTGNGNSLDEYVRGYFFGVVGRWNIFDSFETTAQVDQAKARFESSLLTYEDAMQTVELEVQKAYADLQQFRETIDSQSKNVQQALEALRLAQERLSAGAGTQLEVLDARVALTRARITELQAQGEYVRSMAELERATATGTDYQESFKDPLLILEKRILRQAPPETFNPTDLYRP